MLIVIQLVKKFHTFYLLVSKNLPTFPILCHTTAVRTIPHYIFEINCNPPRADVSIFLMSLKFLQHLRKIIYNLI